MFSMVRKHILFVRISLEQEKILESRKRAFGFTKMSDYVRFTLFTGLAIEEKINKIYEKVIEND